MKQNVAYKNVNMYLIRLRVYICRSIYLITYRWLNKINYLYIMLIYRVTHKSVTHFKNSQQIDFSTDHGSSYADRERNSPSFFIYFTDAQFTHLW